MVNMLKALKKKIDNMSEQMGNFNRDENYKESNGNPRKEKSW